MAYGIEILRLIAVEDLLVFHNTSESNEKGSLSRLSSVPQTAAAQCHQGASSDQRNSLRCVGAIRRGRSVRVTLNGEELLAYEGETVAAALLACGRRALRWTRRSGTPRGLFCGMGVCFDCLVEIDGRPNMQACLTPVTEGMCVVTRSGVSPFRPPE